MAPEQLQAYPVDARTDVFAFGCVLYEMITGRRAFAGDTPASVIAAVLDHEPAPLTQLGARLSSCTRRDHSDVPRQEPGRPVVQRPRCVVGAPTASDTRVTRQAPSHHRSRRSRRSRGPVGDRRAVLALAIAALYRPSNRPPTVRAAPAMRAFIEFPNVWLGSPILSPDGRHVALSGAAGVRSSSGDWRTERSPRLRALSTPCHRDGRLMAGPWPLSAAMNSRP